MMEMIVSLSEQCIKAKSRIETHLGGTNEIVRSYAKIGFFYTKLLLRKWRLSQKMASFKNNAIFRAKQWRHFNFLAMFDGRTRLSSH